MIFFFQEALGIFNTNSLTKYLQAVEELQRNVPGDAEHLEEQRRDVCAKWEVRAAWWALGSGLWCRACSSAESFQASSVYSVIQLEGLLLRLCPKWGLPQPGIILPISDATGGRRGEPLFFLCLATMSQQQHVLFSSIMVSMAPSSLVSTKASSLGWSSFLPFLFSRSLFSSSFD